MLLLPDGTVMAAAQSASSAIGNGWYRLTPDSHGSYGNGTWTTLASMHDARRYCSSRVLRDGRAWVADGEYGTGGAKAEVYNPLTNVWTQAPIPTTLLNPAQNSPATASPQQFVDRRRLRQQRLYRVHRVVLQPVPANWSCVLE